MPGPCPTTLCVWRSLPHLASPQTCRAGRTAPPPSPSPPPSRRTRPCTGSRATRRTSGTRALGRCGGWRAGEGGSCGRSTRGRTNRTGTIENQRDARAGWVLGGGSLGTHAPGECPHPRRPTPPLAFSSLGQNKKKQIAPRAPKASGCGGGAGSRWGSVASPSAAAAHVGDTCQTCHSAARAAGDGLRLALGQHWLQTGRLAQGKLRVIFSFCLALSFDEKLHLFFCSPVSSLSAVRESCFV